jgi:hypothetical protein
MVADTRLPEGYPRVGVVEGDGIVANYGPVLRVQQPGGYLPLFSGRYMELLTGTVNPGVVLGAPRDAAPILHLLGYDVLVDRQIGLVTVFEPPPPRAWVARCVRPGGALEVRQPDFPRTTCIARDGAGPSPELRPPGPARIVAEGAGRLTVEASGPGWLVTTQPWYPGWRAHSRGVPLTVEPVDGALVGVELPEGEHLVQVWYRPAGFDLGLAITVATLLTLAGAWWYDRAGTPVLRSHHSSDEAPERARA